MAPLLAKQSEINNGVNVLEHMYIKYEFISELNVQSLNNLLTRDLEASQC